MKYIKIYKFKNAPRELQGLSDNGGDEDWLAVVPKKIMQQSFDYISFLDGSWFGNSIQKIKRGDNIIFIGSHA